MSRRATTKNIDKRDVAPTASHFCAPASASTITKQDIPNSRMIISKPSLSESEVLNEIDNLDDNPALMFSQEEVEEYLPIEMSQNNPVQSLGSNEIYNGDSNDRQRDDMQNYQSNEENLNSAPDDSQSLNSVSSDDDIEEITEEESEQSGRVKFLFEAQTPKLRKKRRSQRNLKYSNNTYEIKRGRYKSVVWENFTTTRDPLSKNVLTNVCKKCAENVSARSYRMQAHINICHGKIKSKTSVVTETDSAPASVSTSSKPFLKAKEIVFPSHSEVQQRMKSWVDTIEPREKSSVDQKLAKFIYSANLPFVTVENPYFKDFCKALKPSYQLPSSKIIGTTLLNSVHKATNDYNMENLKGKKVTILQDGWSTKQNVPVIAHCLHTGTRTFYLNAVDTNTESKTAEYCLHLLEKAIGMAESKFECKIIGVGTDNCETMNALRRACSSKYPDINVFGCQSHIFNLLGQDLTPTELIKKIVTIQKFFRSHHFESAALKNLEGCRPVLPGATRWNSQLDTLRSFNNNQTKYLDVSRMKGSNVAKNLEVYSVLNDPFVFENVESTLKLLEPVAISLDKCQEETALISDAVHRWIYLTKNIKLSDFQKGLFERRRKMGMTPLAISAYMLHPLYRGEGLTSEDKKAGHNFLESKSPFFVAAAMYLESSDEEFFPKTALNKDVIKHLTPSLWWKRLLNYNTITSELVDFAENLMILPASSASLERCFSTMGNILTIRRNRLGTAKVEKLCSVYRSLLDQKIFAQDDFLQMDDEVDDDVF